MSISPKYLVSNAFHQLVRGVRSPAAHQIHLYLDYNCPFAGKLFYTFVDKVIPELETRHPGKFEVVFAHVVQPWHPQSTFLHEVALAVARLKPEAFWTFLRVLFDHHDEYSDADTLNQTRKEIYTQLAQLAETTVGVSAAEILKLVLVSPDNHTNVGNAVTVDIKYFTRYHRTVGVHVTPTVLVDGITNALIELSTPVDKLLELFAAV